LFDKRLQLLPSFGTILHRGANLVQKIQSLVDLSLSIGRIEALRTRWGSAGGESAIAGIKVAVYRGVAIAAATCPIISRPALSIAALALARLASTCLPGLTLS
jgi:hypothetical protein